MDSVKLNKVCASFKVLIDLESFSKSFYWDYLFLVEFLRIQRHNHNLKYTKSIVTNTNIFSNIKHQSKTKKTIRIHIQYTEHHYSRKSRTRRKSWSRWKATSFSRCFSGPVIFHGKHLVSNRKRRSLGFGYSNRMWGRHLYSRFIY